MKFNTYHMLSVKSQISRQHASEREEIWRERQVALYN